MPIFVIGLICLALLYLGVKKLKKYNVVKEKETKLEELKIDEEVLNYEERIFEKENKINKRRNELNDSKFTPDA